MRIGTCSIPECSRTKIVALNLCNTHYRRLKKHGDPLHVKVMREHDGQCAVESCGRPFHCKGFCKRHYSNFRKHGHPTWRPARKRPKRRPAVDRFFEKITEAKSGCWEWQGCKNHLGYGRFNPDGVTIGAHRWSYQNFHGPIPPGLVVDHMCHNPSCVNPEHLRAVTQKTNAQNRGPLDPRNTTGFRGVARISNSNHFRAYVGVDGKQVYLGAFDSAEEAAKIAKAARRKLHAVPVKEAVAA